MVKLKSDLVNSKVVEGRTTITVPFEKGTTVFSFPLVGPFTYDYMGKEILNEGLILPTFGDTVRLTHAAYFPKKDARQLESIRDITCGDNQWGFTVNVWTDKGVYCINDERAMGSSMTFKLSELEKEVKKGRRISKGVVISEDGTIRFARNYRLGEHSSKSLADDGFVIALTGSKEEANRLARISRRFRYKPITEGAELFDGKNLKVGVSILGAGFQQRLIINGCANIDDCDCFASGLVKT